MKTLKFIALCLGASAFLYANPAVMGGITYSFGDSKNSLEGAGVGVKVLSSGKDKKPVVGAGFTYYPWADEGEQFGLEAGVGYTVKNTAVMGGWDFLKKQPTVSLGYNKEINSKGKFGDEPQDAVCSHGKK